VIDIKNKRLASVVTDLGMLTTVVSSHSNDTSLSTAKRLTAATQTITVYVKLRTRFVSSTVCRSSKIRKVTRRETSILMRRRASRRGII
jgi:hypothetical protein